jgi:hypothetical protein
MFYTSTLEVNLTLRKDLRVVRFQLLRGSTTLLVFFSLAQWREYKKIRLLFPFPAQYLINFVYYCKNQILKFFKFLVFKNQILKRLVYNKKIEIINP